MKRYRLIQTLSVFLICLLVGILNVNAQVEDLEVNSKQKIKTGWVPAGLPVVAYDADMGFQYGIIGNLQDFGDGSIFPEYRHQFMLEISRFTKGSGVNQLFYDSKYLIPKNIRITADIAYLTERALNFYGFNGYETAYVPGFEDEDSEDYISRVFYRHDRRLFRFVVDLQGRILKSQGDKFRWLGGVSIFNIKINTVDIDKLNKGKDDDKKLPDTALLYDQYVDWGIIGENEKSGGQMNFFKVGLIYDTRDNESSPNRGVWEEAILLTAPKFFFNDFSFTKFVLTHRHYIGLVKEKLTFAYRLSYQGTIGGTTPFFFQPMQIYSFSTATKSDGLGGSKNLRGIMRNRVVGDSFVYGNVELRWKFFKTVLWNQNIYLGFTAFSDAGQTVKNINVNRDLLPPEDLENYFDQTSDNLHWTYGAGLRIGWNENFIIAVDYGFASDGRDGTRGLYVGINNLF